MINNHQFGLISVSGADAVKFLQGQVTCNVETLDSQGCRGAFCTPKGRVYCSFYLASNQQAENEILLRMDKTIIEYCLATLKKYTVFFKVSLQDVSDMFDIIFGMDLPVDSPIQHYCIETDQPLLQEVWLKKSSNKLTQENIESQSWLDLQLVRCGLFDINHHWVEQWLPHNMGLQRKIPNTQPAISYDKGCYTGQEIVARTHYLGNVKKTLHFKIIDDDEIAEGDDLLNQENKIIGKVVKLARSERGTEMLIIGNQK